MGIPLLEPAFCRNRQRRLQRLLNRLELDAAVFTNRHYVHALTGYWHEQPLKPVAVVIVGEATAAIVVPDSSADSVDTTQSIDKVATYRSHELGTIIESPDSELFAAVDTLLGEARSVGSCFGPSASRSGLRSFTNISAPYQELRRAKDPDELAILQYAIAAAESALAEARRLLRPGATEIDIYAAMLSAATRAVGEQLSGWGNDFQSGSLGSQPRNHAVQAGDLAIFDVGVGVRGYRSDLCRAFAVDGSPTEVQSQAHRRIVETFGWLESHMKPGVSCRLLFEEVSSRLDGWHGCTFPHHLGHGVGLDAHEVPRLNPKRDDILALGDVVAVEPALYREDLRAGIRLEHDYVVTETGVTRLSSYPLDL